MAEPGATSCWHRVRVCSSMSTSSAWWRRPSVPTVRSSWFRRSASSWLPARRSCESKVTARASRLVGRHARARVSNGRSSTTSPTGSECWWTSPSARSRSPLPRPHHRRSGDRPAPRQPPPPRPPPLPRRAVPRRTRRGAPDRAGDGLAGLRPPRIRRDPPGRSRLTTGGTTDARCTRRLARRSPPLIDALHCSDSGPCSTKLCISPPGSQPTSSSPWPRTAKASASPHPATATRTTLTRASGIDRTRARRSVESSEPGAHEIRTCGARPPRCCRPDRGRTRRSSRGGTRATRVARAGPRRRRRSPPRRRR